MATSQSSTSLTYAALATAGPAVTVTIPASGHALVTLTVKASNAIAADFSYMGFAVSGSTTLPATEAQSFVFEGKTSRTQASATYLVTGLTAGSNTFTAEYKVNASTGTWANRSIIVIPLP